MVIFSWLGEHPRIALGLMIVGAAIEVLAYCDIQKKDGKPRLNPARTYDTRQILQDVRRGWTRR
jgi:hypothetical protein